MIEIFICLGIAIYVLGFCIYGPVKNCSLGEALIWPIMLLIIPVRRAFCSNGVKKLKRLEIEGKNNPKPDYAKIAEMEFDTDISSGSNVTINLEGIEGNETYEDKTKFLVALENLPINSWYTILDKNKTITLYRINRKNEHFYALKSDNNLVGVFDLRETFVKVMAAALESTSDVITGTMDDMVQRIREMKVNDKLYFPLGISVEKICDSEPYKIIGGKEYNYSSYENIEPFIKEFKYRIRHAVAYGGVTKAEEAE